MEDEKNNNLSTFNRNNLSKSKNFVFELPPPPNQKTKQQICTHINQIEMEIVATEEITQATALHRVSEFLQNEETIKFGPETKAQLERIQQELQKELKMGSANSETTPSSDTEEKEEEEEQNMSIVEEEEENKKKKKKKESQTPERKKKKSKSKSKTK